MRSIGLCRQNPAYIIIGFSMVWSLAVAAGRQARNALGQAIHGERQGEGVWVPGARRDTCSDKETDPLERGHES